MNAHGEREPSEGGGVMERVGMESGGQGLKLNLSSVPYFSGAVYISKVHRCL